MSTAGSAADRHQAGSPGGKLEHFDLAIHGPAMRCGAGSQFLFRFRQGDVEALFASFRPLHQEAQRDGGLAGAGIALEQEHMAGSEAAGQNIIQAGNASSGFSGPRACIVHEPLQTYPNKKV
jgi:hypothetical protein